MAPSKPSRAISWRADNLVSAGLADDFVGTITNPRFAPYNYQGKRDHYVLAFGLDIVPDEDSGFDPFTQWYSCGDKSLEQFRPSKDGDEPLDVESWDGSEATIGDVSGPFVVPTGTKTQMNASSNHAHLMEVLLQLLPDFDGVDASELDNKRFRFNRLPQKVRKGLINAPQEGQQRRNNDILLPTEYLGEATSKPAAAKKGATAAKAAPKAAKAAPAAAASNGDFDLDKAIEDAIAEAAEKAGGSLAKTKIAPVVIKALPGEHKGAGVARAGQMEFLEAATRFAFDADTNTILFIQ